MQPKQSPCASAHRGSRERQASGWAKADLIKRGWVERCITEAPIGITKPAQTLRVHAAMPQDHGVRALAVVQRRQHGLGVRRSDLVGHARRCLDTPSIGMHAHVLVAEFQPVGLRAAEDERDQA